MLLCQFHPPLLLMLLYLIPGTSCINSVLNIYLVSNVRWHVTYCLCLGNVSRFCTAQVFSTEYLVFSYFCRSCVSSGGHALADSKEYVAFQIPTVVPTTTFVRASNDLSSDGTSVDVLLCCTRPASASSCIIDSTIITSQTLQGGEGQRLGENVAAAICLHRQG